MSTSRILLIFIIFHHFLLLSVPIILNLYIYFPKNIGDRPYLFPPPEGGILVNISGFGTETMNINHSRTHEEILKPEDALRTVV